MYMSAVDTNISMCVHETEHKHIVISQIMDQMCVGLIHTVY